MCGIARLRTTGVLAGGDTHAYATPGTHVEAVVLQNETWGTALRSGAAV
jgi:hypothetical protein